MTPGKVGLAPVAQGWQSLPDSSDETDGFVAEATH